MMFLSAYRKDQPPWADAAFLLLSGAMLCCLIAVGSVLIGAFRRSPVPYLAASLVLAAAMGLLAGPEIDVWRQPDLPAIWNWTELPAWTVPVGIGCVLLTLITGWVMRPRPVSPA